MMPPKLFCKGCGRRLINIPLVGERIVEFEDGFYCEKCSRERVESKRRKI
jgi:hypothetical protein